MIDFLRGTVTEINNKYIVVETNFIGYMINMSEIEIRELSPDDDVKIYTRLVVREDSLTLYGFLTRDVRRVFDLLTTVSSIGPKVGIGVLSNLSIADIIKAIRTSNIDSLTQAPGIGKKTAQRIILELKDKVSEFDIHIEDEKETEIVNEDAKGPAVEALISLGYNKYEAQKALKSVDENLEISKMIKEGLKNLGR